MSTTQYNLHLKGFVGGSDFDRNYVDYVLAKHNGKPVNVLIDSLGGSVATALSIASAFRNHSDVAVHFVGMNASAATIASLGAKHISIDANAMYLVHKCSQGFFEWGALNADQFAELIADCEKIKADLDKLDFNIAQMYSRKTSKPAAELLDLMQRGGWLTAKEAKEWGFVDEITDLPEEAAPKLTDAVASEMAAVGMPIPNVPVADRESSFAKFLASLASLFRPSTKPDSKMTSEETKHPSADAERIAQLEKDLAERDKTINDLKAQVDELNKKPADETTSVVDDAKPSPIDTTSDPVAEYFAAAKEARKIYDLLP